MNAKPAISWAAIAPAILIGSTLVSVLLILVLRPLLTRYAIAQPNARSSHNLPTPQGGGIAVIISVITVSYGACLVILPGGVTLLKLPLLCAALVLIAGVGVLADIHPGHFVARLVLQALAVTTVVMALPPELRVVPVLPLPLERVLLVTGGLWFVNLVNFMDGLDWMTAAEVVPVSGAVAAIGLLGILPPFAIVVSLALCGAMLGFAYFNRPIAKLFLGDVGSLPVGLILGWLLILLAGAGGRTAAILLPLYYLADSSITLARRALKSEKVWHAHRSHFYQRATDRGLSVLQVVRRVLAVNLALAALALTTVLLTSRDTNIACLAGGGALVGSLLISFARGNR